MKDTVLFIDSTTVLPVGFVAEHGITVMPVPIYAGGKEYRDGVDITPEEFMALLETSAERPSTAVPGLGEFVSFYEQLLQGHEHIVYPVPSLKLSGLFDAAIQAAELLERATIVAVDPPQDWGKELYALRSSDPHLEERLAGICHLRPPVIAVVNTGYASGASGLVVLPGLMAMEAGEPLAEVLRATLVAKRNTNIYLHLNTLDYIVDRVGQLQAFVGTLLNIKPILTFMNNDLVDAARVRGKGQAKRKIIELTKERVGQQEVDLYVLHSLAAEEAAELLEQARGELNVRNAWLGGIGASVSRYTGRGGLGIAFTVV
jgi:fatty acid-binding protein DegV